MPLIQSLKDFAILNRQSDGMPRECIRCLAYDHNGHLWPARWHPRNLEPLNLTFTTIGYSKSSPNPPTSVCAGGDLREIEAMLRDDDIDSLEECAWRDNRVVRRCIIGVRHIRISTNQIIDNSENTKVAVIHGFVVLALAECAKLQLAAYDDHIDCQLYMRKLHYSGHSCWITPDMVILRNPKYGSIPGFLPVLFSSNPKVPQAYAIAYILAYAQLRLKKYTNESVTHICVLQFTGKSVQFVSANVTRLYIESVERYGVACQKLPIAISKAFDLGEPKARVGFKHALKTVLGEIFPPVVGAMLQSEWQSNEEQINRYRGDSGAEACLGKYRPQIPENKAQPQPDIGVDCGNGTTFKGSLKRKVDRAELTVYNLERMLKRRTVVRPSELEGLKKEIKNLSGQIEHFVNLKKAQEMQCEIEGLSDEIEEKAKLSKSLEDA